MVRECQQEQPVVIGQNKNAGTEHEQMCLAWTAGGTWNGRIAGSESAAAGDMMTFQVVSRM